MILACFVLFAIGIAAVAWITLRPRGERVGDLDLQTPLSTLQLDVPAASTLNFRLEVTVGTSGPQTSSRATRDAIYKKLGESEITLSDAGPNGNALSTRCAAFDGKSTSAGSSSSEVSISGIPIACTLSTLAPGRHVLTAKVVWAKDTEVRTATLEVRREPSSGSP